jgi:hypothetical protein
MGPVHQDAEIVMFWTGGGLEGRRPAGQEQAGGNAHHESFHHRPPSVRA